MPYFLRCSPQRMQSATRLLQIVLLLALTASPSLTSASFSVPAPPVIGAKSYMLVDGNSGYELASLEPDVQLAPASLTKIMSAYAIFKALDEGQITLDDKVTVSEKAWRTPGSRMFIEVGKRVAVKDLIMGMIVQSGNDASVALAEHVAGTESVFAEVMNRYAVELGMNDSHFMNATGLPHEDHYSTARDMATVARAMIDEFPEYYGWYSLPEFTYNDITQANRNRLLRRDSSVDGMKTGHTVDAGYCLIASAERDGMRIISVVLGTASPKTRNDGSQALLNYGFRFYETRLLYRAGETVTEAKIWKSARERTALGLPEDLYITVPRGTYDEVESVLSMPSVLVAPVAQGQPLAELEVSLNGSNLVTAPLRALQENPPGSMWQRGRDAVMLLLE
ncbi:MAG TPA: D-alanyl-D-alanine carboxypeptidase family protein [Woeseiaceae bacterium]|nr:D-alanyl-D-alanine carboxypeptidase family protein [Woeseiaceae bacterium]